MMDGRKDPNFFSHRVFGMRTLVRSMRPLENNHDGKQDPIHCKQAVNTCLMTGIEMQLHDRTSTRDD